MKKHLNHIPVTGKIKVLSGLRIGAGGAGIEIGGLDNPIIRHPGTRIPYLPGSSLKGKLRSLLETGTFRTGKHAAPDCKVERGTVGPCTCNHCIVCWLFGCGDPRAASEPTRLIFRDCPISETSMEEQAELLEEGIFYSEVKAEVTMDRESGKVGRAGPRSMDRIMAGTHLDFSLTVRVLEGDDEAEMKEVLLHAIHLLEQEGLGGSVSRGYGQVRFEGLKWDGQDISQQLHPVAD